MNFELDKDEMKKINQFITIHENKHGECKAAIGGRYTFSFTPTSLGTIIKVQCGSCEEQLDITEYENW